MYLEMKKFYKSSVVLVLLVLALLLSVVMPIVFISDYESYDYSTGKEVASAGLNGIKEKKKQVKQITGILETKKLNEALTLYQSIPDEEKAYAKVQENYPELVRFLKEAYAPFGEKAIFSLNGISNADDFYDRAMPQIKSRINSYGENYLSPAETMEVAKRIKAIETPYQYAFMDHWTIVFKSLTFVYGFIVLATFLISSQLFSYEKEKDMDLILTPMGKKKLLLVGYNKMLALIVYLTAEFIMCSTVVCSIVFGTAEVSGWNCPLQILPDFFTVVYNWSIGDLFILSLMISWLCILSIASIGALVNSFFQKTYVSLILSAFLTLLPLGLRYSDYMEVGIQKILYLHPANGVSMLSYIDSLFSYGIGSMRVITPAIIGVIAALGIIVCCLLSPRLFAKRLHQ